jgi:hypothetical protein
MIYVPRPWYAVLGMSAVALGFLGLLFAWMMPLGLILAAVGFLLGIVGWFAGVIRDGAQPGIVIVGTILSLISLFLNVILLTGGLA